MATLTEKQKKFLFQQLKPWSDNFLAWRSRYSNTLLSSWYQTNIVGYSGLLIWQVGYGPRTYPVTIALPKGSGGPFLRRVKYIGPGSNSAKNAKAYRDSGDAQADKDAIIKFQTGQLDSLKQLRSSVAGILPLALGSAGSNTALAELDRIINLMDNEFTKYKNGPIPIL